MVIYLNDQALPSIYNPCLHKVRSVGLDLNNYIRSLNFKLLDTCYVAGKKRIILIVGTLIVVLIKIGKPLLRYSAV